MAVAAFTVPSLMWKLRLAPKPAPKTAVDAGSWAFTTVQNGEDVEQLLLTLDPLIRGLTLAGYEVQGVAYAVVPGGAGPSDEAVDWLYVEDLRTMHILHQTRGWTEGLGLRIPTGAEALVALLVRSREMYAGRGPLYGVRLPVTSATFDFDDVPPPGGTGPAPPWRHAVDALAEDDFVEALQIALVRQAPDDEPVPLEEVLAGLDASCRYLLGVLEIDYMQGAAAFAQLPDQAAPHGLLGMFDPTTWTFPRERWAPAGVEGMSAFGKEIWTALAAGGSEGLTAFVHGELLGTAELHDTIREARGSLAGGTAAVRAFGEAMADRMKSLRGEVDPDAVPVLDELPRATWTDALMTAHCLEVVDVLGYAPVDPSFDETPAKRDQFDVTGFYESVPLEREHAALPPPAELQTLQLNQAGEVLIGYWQTRALDADGAFHHIVNHRVVATRVAGQVARYTFTRTLLGPEPATAPPDTVRGDATGTLTFTEVVRGKRTTIALEVEFDDAAGRADDQLDYVLVRPEPHLSSAALASVPAGMQARLESDQRRPLHSKERSYWDVAIDRLIDDTRTYLLLDMPSTKAVEAAELDLLFRATASTFWRFTTRGTREDNGQTPTLKDIAAEELASRTLTIGNDERTAFTWLNEMLADRQQAAGSQPPNTVHVEAALDLAAVAALFGASTMYRYEWYLTVGGLAGEVGPVGAGAFTGDMTITKKDPATGAVIWEQGYWATFGQVSKGFGGGVIWWQENWGEIDWPVDWTQEQFEGEFTIDAVQGGYAFPFLDGGDEEGEEDEPSPEEEALGQDRDEWSGITYGIAGTIRFLGDRTFLPMIGDETGLGRIEGVFAGAEAGTASGVLVRLNDEVQNPIDADVILAALGSVVRLEDAAEDVALFAVNSASITTDGLAAAGPPRAPTTAPRSRPRGRSCG